MQRRHWLAGGPAALVLPALAFILTGGTYRTVSAGGGRVYIVNRFTGRAYDLGRAAKPAKLDPATRAIDLVRHEPADRWLTDDYPGATVDEWFRQVARNARGRVRTIGWRAHLQPDGLYVVSFRAERPGHPATQGLAWEVDLNNRVVRFINDDEELAKHDGFDALPTVGVAPIRSGRPAEASDEELDRIVREDRESRFIPPR